MLCAAASTSPLCQLSLTLRVGMVPPKRSAENSSKSRSLSMVRHD